MREEFGDLWDLSVKIHAHAICLTTNGTIALSGRGVMGKGVALQAKLRFAQIEIRLGDLLRQNGNIVQHLDHYGPIPIYTFPVKHEWFQMADLRLIHRSACQLMAVVVDRGFETVLLPRPGCGNGGLDWSEVRPIIEPVLDDRIIVIDRR